MPRAKGIDRKKRRDFKMPLWVQVRTPAGLSPLAEFIESCGDEVSVDEAVREYQREWCSHPRDARKVITTMVSPGEERAEYRIVCTECGLIRLRQGRPSSDV